MSSHSTKRRIPVKLCCIVVTVAAIAALSIFAAVDLGRRMTAGRTSEVQPDDRQARYILFPRDAGLRRAIIVSGTELYGTGEIGYYDGEIERHIARDRLSLYPTPEKSEEYVAALNGEISRWGKETDLRKIDFSLEGKRANLTEYLKSGKIDRYVYDIRDDRTAGNVTIRHGL